MADFFKHRSMRQVCLCYFFLTLAPGLFFSGETPNCGEALARYILPGVLACFLAGKCYGANWREALCVKRMAAGLICCAPVGVLCAANLLWGGGGEGVTLERLMWICAAALGEELLGRFLLLRGLLWAAENHNRSAWTAIFLSGLLFGAAHLVNFTDSGILALFQCVYTSAIGVLFSWSYWKTGNLWGGIVWHILLNLTGLC